MKISPRDSLVHQNAPQSERIDPPRVQAAFPAHRTSKPGLVNQPSDARILIAVRIGEDVRRLPEKRDELRSTMFDVCSRLVWADMGQRHVRESVPAKFDPFRFETRSSVVLRCRKCRDKGNVSLTAGTVMA